MTTKRVKPTVSLTLPLEQTQWLAEPAATRGIPMSKIVEEALTLLQVGMVYQMDKRRLTVNPGIVKVA